MYCSFSNCPCQPRVLSTEVVQLPVNANESVLCEVHETCREMGASPLLQRCNVQHSTPRLHTRPAGQRVHNRVIYFAALSSPYKKDEYRNTRKVEEGDNLDCGIYAVGSTWRA